MGEDNSVWASQKKKQGTGIEGHSLHLLPPDGNRHSCDVGLDLPGSCIIVLMKLGTERTTN